MIKTIEWTDEGVRMIDQRLLPTEEKYLTLRSCEEVADAVKQMVVRGAPAIGVSAAMGIALGSMQAVGTSVPDLEDDFEAMWQRGWTDGLPVVPPTEARVLAMLEGTTRAPDEIGTLSAAGDSDQKQRKSFAL